MEKTRKIDLRAVTLLVVVCSLITIFVLDDRQQKNFRDASMGYWYMEQGEYEEATEKFTKYLSSHNSLRFWNLIEKVNGTDSEYTYQNVSNALKICERELNY